MANKIIVLATLVFFVFLSFWPSLFNHFTNWDDDKFLTANSIVQDFSWDNLCKIWTMHFEGGYQPLTMFSFAVEQYFLKLNPFIYHFDNLLLHAANTCLVFLIVSIVARSAGMALVTALLFAVHPLRVESVAWVSERKDVLFSFFYLAALLAYLKNRGGVCTVLFVLACLAKHQAASLPLVLLLIDGKFDAHSVFKKTPLFMVSAAFLSTTLWSAVPQWNNMHMYLWPDKIFLVNYALLIYAVKSVVPYQLSCIYPYPGKVNGLFPVAVYISPLIVVWLVFLVRHTVRHTRLIAFGSLFFLITIALPLATIFSGGYFIFDRYTYLPSIGIFLIIAYLLEKKNILLTGLLVGYTLLMSWMTFERCKVWFNGVTLWSDVIKQYPKFVVVYDNRGAAYTLMGQDDLALQDFSKAIGLNPHYAGSYNNRALIYAKRGQADLALKDFNGAIAADPNYGAAYFNRSISYFRAGHARPALEDVVKAKALGMDVPDWYMRNLKTALKGNGG